jgi:glycosyltransferase involved in cell wall biosynthesis
MHGHSAVPLRVVPADEPSSPATAEVAAPRIVFLYSEPSPYIVACWRELKKRYDAELMIFHWDTNEAAPFILDIAPIGKTVSRKGLSKDEILERVLAFNPDGIFVSGWADRDYLRVGAECKKRGIPVILGLDTQWTGSLKQRFGCATARLWLHPAVNVIWTPGERQAQLANHLGYRGKNCWYGVYCCDWRSFSPAGADIPERESSFLFVGRYAEEKGISDLVKAYSIYRTKADDPWPLYCAGLGPLNNLLGDVAGIHDLGFVQPDALPSVMRQYGGVFILPSRVEPWGVVLQEAAAAECPLICSSACGAGVHLLQDGLNGLRFERANPEELADCMLRLSSVSHDRREQMGKASALLARQYTPERWAQTIVEGVAQRKRAE